MRSLVYVSMISLFVGVPSLLIFCLIARSNSGNQNVNSFSIQGVFKLLSEVIGLYLLLSCVVLFIELISELGKPQGDQGVAFLFTIAVTVVAFLITLALTILTFRIKIKNNENNPTSTN